MVKGYKVFDKDWSCRNFQYEVGKTYEMNGDPVLCEKGFHFCTKLADCFNYYSFNSENKVAEIEALGDIDESNSDSKCCTNKIKIIKELSWHEVLDLANAGKENMGLGNTGRCNRGYYNSGYCNYFGSRNSGDYNTGDNNSGSYNSGNYNSGRRNLGYCNSGNYNSGNYNSGDYNSGNYNSGDYNTGDYNSGIFNTISNQKIIIFNKPSHWTYSDWIMSDVRSILSTIPLESSEWVSYNDMTEEEKQKHPNCKITNGYLKEIKVSKEDKQKWWDELSEEYKEIVMSLPNFDPEIFYECTEIETHNDYTKFKETGKK